MVTHITLTDIGKYDVAQNYPSGTDERAYGSNGSEGTALTINAYEVTCEHACALNIDPATQKKKSDTSTLRFEWGEVDKNAIIFPVWTVKCFFDTTATTTDMRDFGRLLHMYKTKGYKTLGVGATTDCELIAYNQYGEREKDGEGTKTVSSINVRIMSITCRQVIKKGYKIDCEIKLVQTG